MKPISAFNSLPLAARRAILTFGVAGLIAAVYTVLYQPALSLGPILVLLALAAASARAKVKLYKDTSLSFLTSVVLLAVITQGPAVAVLIAVFGVTVQSFLPKRRLVLHQAVFNAGMISVTVTATWWIHHALAAGLPLPQVPAETTATVLASFTYFLGNSVSVSLMVALSKGMSMFHVWATHFMYSAPSFLIAGMLSLGLIALAGTASLWIFAALMPVVVFPYYCAVRLTSQTAK